MTEDAPRPRRVTARLVVAVIVTWIAIGLVAGTAEYLASRSGGVAGSWRASLYSPVLAGCIWSLLTIGAVVLADRFPLSRGQKAHVALHLGVAAAVPFVLNASFLLISYGILGTGFPGWTRFRADTLSAGLRWLHVNAGSYLAIVLLWQAYRARRSVPRPAAAVAASPRVAARSGGTLHRFDAAEIDWIEGAGDYVKLHVQGREVLADERLRDLEARLEEWGFLRVHRSAIVNLRRVEALDRRTRSDWVVVLPGGERVNVSRGRRKAVREAWSRLEVPDA